MNHDAANPGNQNSATEKIDMIFSKPISLNFINNIEILEDDHILIPKEIMEKSRAPFERTLYGYFVGKRLAFSLVKDRLEDLWKEHGICDIFINNDDMFFFKFDNDKELFNKDGLSLISRKLGKPLEVDSYTSTVCERATGRAVYARILIEMSANDPWENYIKIKAITAKGAISTTLKVEYSWNPKRCDHCKIFGHELASCPTHTTSIPVQKTATPTPREADIEGYQMVKRRNIPIPIPKKKVQVDNRKGKGPALKIAQVYKPIIRDQKKKKNVSSNMFDALSHQRIDDTEDDSSIRPVIHPRDTPPPFSDTHPSSSHGGHISIPVDQG
ncbi:unnamed protein product [Lactuca virosa]|uniref:DUF4283 domain-containing protein n=1 Tax=Lactuca virosa TaxID=75947 RepID=A0AAU9MIB6_9ASTR|nr:unnamed protein product [Lactuca virosa]